MPAPTRLATIRSRKAIAFHCLLGIKRVQVFDIDPAATQKLCRNLAAYPALQVVPAASVAAAVQGADIVTTVTADKRNAVILTPEMLEPGMHINAIGGDCPGKTELHRDVPARAMLRAANSEVAAVRKAVLMVSSLSSRGYPLSTSASTPNAVTVSSPRPGFDGWPLTYLNA